MRKTIGTAVEETLEDLGYFTRRALTFMTGKASTQIGVTSLLGFVMGVADPTEHLLTTAIAVSGVMGVSAGLVQMDHTHRKAQLLDRYREEISKVTGKSPAKVQEQDLLDVANGSFTKNIPRNPTLRQALKQSTTARNIGVLVSAAAAAATFFIISSTLGHVDFGHFTSVGQAAGELLSHGLAGFLTYNVIKQPLHFIAAKVMGLREETVDDCIATIKRARAHGKLIAQEQVLDVYIEAHPQLGENIKTGFGKDFADMNVAEKIRVMESIPKDQFDLRKVTEDINLGHIKPEELAFMAFGQRSGVERKARNILPARPAIVDGLWNFLNGLTAGWTAPARETTDAEVAAALPALPGKTDYIIHSPDENTAAMGIRNTEEKDGAKRSFAAMVGRKHTPEGISHVERYEQSVQQPDVVLNR